MPTTIQPLNQATAALCIQWLRTALSYQKIYGQDSSLVPACIATAAQGFRNSFMQHSCSQSWRHHFIHLSPTSAARYRSCRVTLPESWSWTSSRICFLICFSQKSDELATGATEIAPGDFARSVLESAQTNYSVSKSVMWNTTAEWWHTAGEVKQHRRGGQITAYRNSRWVCLGFFLF